RRRGTRRSGFRTRRQVGFEHRRNTRRMFAALMTRKAAHLGAPAKAVLVDFEGHRDHGARGFLGGLIVQFEFALHVAHFAVAAQRGRDELHGGNQLVRGYPFKRDHVLVGLVGGLRRGRRRRPIVLREREGRRREKNRN